jgi:hypothetical protein
MLFVFTVVENDVSPKKFHPMTIEIPQRSRYKELLATVGEQIDSEIASLLKVYALPVLSDHKCEPQHQGQKYRDPPAKSDALRAVTSEKEVLAALRGGDSRRWIELINQSPRNSLNTVVLEMLPTEILRAIMPDCSDEAVKVIFQIACSSGITDMMTDASEEWQKRLLFHKNEQGLSSLQLSMRTPDCFQILMDDIFPSLVEDPEILKSALSSVVCTDMLEKLLERIPVPKLPGIVTEEMLSSTSAGELLESYLVVGLSVNGNDTYRCGKFDDSVNHYLRAIKICRESPRDHSDNLIKLEYNVGRALYRSGRFMESIDHCTACLELDPNDMNALSQRSQTTSMLSEPSYYKKLIHLFFILESPWI